MRERETRVDHEFKEIAEQLVEKHSRFFPDDFNLERFMFIRTSYMRPKWVARIRKCGHPWGGLPGLESIIYLVETADDHWQALTKAQQVLIVFHELKHVPKGGCDFQSKDCGKVLDHPIQDFPECVAAANGNLFWNEPGYEDVPNLLEDPTTFDLENSLERVGFLNDPERSEFELPSTDQPIKDLVEAMLKLMHESKTENEIRRRLRNSVRPNEPAPNEPTPNEPILNETVNVEEV